MKAVIRGMLASDWESVRLIYLQGIATGNATFETDAPSWEQWDASHLPSPRIVACSSNGEVQGWASVSPVSKRKVYSGVAEVSVYVAEECRGHGVGRKLLDELIRQSELNGIWTLQASVFPENLGTIALHKSCGFREVGTREKIGQLEGVWRDTLLLERRSKTQI